MPAEVPALWPTEAVRAQAVAARGYAFVSLKSGGSFDVRPTAADQVYGGVRIEHPASTQAVVDTTGQVVVNAKGNPRRTYFFATGGGATENIAYAWPNRDGSPGSSAGYLVGRIDTDKNGVPFDIRGRDPSKTLSAYQFSWQTGSFTLAQLNRVIASNANTAPAGKISDISQIKFDYGVSRVYRVTIVGDKRTVTVSSIVFKGAYNKAVDSGIVSGGKLNSTMYFLEQLP